MKTPSEVTRSCGETRGSPQPLSIPEVQCYTRRIMGLRPLPSALTLGAAVLATVLAWEIFTPAPALDAGGVVVEIPAHRGVLGVAAALRDAGVIRSRAAFITLTLVRGSARKLQAGEYEVERATDTMGVLRLLETGRVKQHIVLHPEGATVTELAGELERERIASAAATLRVARDPAFLRGLGRSEEHTSELQSQSNLVCRLLLEKRKKLRPT